LLAIDEAAFPTELFAELPRLRLTARENLPVAGASYWTHGSWVIAVNGSEPWQRQRLTTMHEFKHILDHTNKHLLYHDTRYHSSYEQAERVARETEDGERRCDPDEAAERGGPDVEHGGGGEL